MFHLAHPLSSAECSSAAAEGKNGFAWGTLGGLAMFALCFAVTLISGGFTGTEFLPKLISSAVCGCIGGIIGVNIAAER
ncbi:MAG: TIGR04086 family membrane protein [[Eubacterium] siraeum]